MAGLCKFTSASVALNSWGKAKPRRRRETFRALSPEDEMA